MKFYATFGLGTVLAKSYLLCSGPDENTVRLRLNADMAKGILPKWAGIYPDDDLTRETLAKFDLAELPVAYEAVDQFSSGPVKR